MYAWLIIFTAIPITASSIHRHKNTSVLLESWFNRVIDNIPQFPCKSYYFSDVNLCSQIRSLHSNQVNLYAAHSDKLLKANVPSHEFTTNKDYNLVIVVDPLPTKSFPHPVLIYLIDDEKPEFQSAQTRHGYYIPHVETKAGISGDLLNCIDDLVSTASCPIRPSISLALNEDPCQTSRIHPSCHNQKKTHGCKDGMICNFGVIIMGGWNKNNVKLTEETSALNAYHGMRKLGIPAENVVLQLANAKTFIHWGTSSIPVPVIGAEDRALTRSRIRHICSHKHCADHLIIYLGGIHNKHNGAIMLWDTNTNGHAEKKELYTIRNLLKDIKDCTANRVIILVDQIENADNIVRTFKQHETETEIIVLVAEQLGNYLGRNDVSSSIKDIHRKLGKEAILLHNGLKENGTLSNRIGLGSTLIKEHGCLKIPRLLWTAS
uniref:Wie-1 n=1 Tax=Hofstenia miamia TaxID=442651 RepID=A0A8K1R2G0_HOFMI|nr:wie-1 [Hofstenia miamia]